MLQAAVFCSHQELVESLPLDVYSYIDIVHYKFKKVRADCAIVRKIPGMPVSASLHQMSWQKN